MKKLTLYENDLINLVTQSYCAGANSMYQIGKGGESKTLDQVQTEMTDKAIEISKLNTQIENLVTI